MCQIAARSQQFVCFFYLLLLVFSCFPRKELFVQWCHRRCTLSFTMIFFCVWLFHNQRQSSCWRINCEIPLLGNGGGGMTGIKEDEEDDKQRVETLKKTACCLCKLPNWPLLIRSSNHVMDKHTRLHTQKCAHTHTLRGPINILYWETSQAVCIWS